MFELLFPIWFLRANYFMGLKSFNVFRRGSEPVRIAVIRF